MDHRPGGSPLLSYEANLAKASSSTKGLLSRLGDLQQELAGLNARGNDLNRILDEACLQQLEDGDIHPHVEVSVIPGV